MLCDVNVATQMLGNSSNAQTYGQVASKHIPDRIVVPIGRSLRFKKDELAEWIEQGGSKNKSGDESERTDANQ
jgi:predicted DNA-binding transcriptional regulator AlpA